MQMRRIFILGILAVMTMSCSQKKFQLDLTLEGSEGQELVVFLAEEGKYNAIDTLQFETNHMVWEHNFIGEQSICVMQPQSRNGLYLFVDNNKFTVTGEYKTLAKVNVETESPAYADYKSFLNVVEPFSQKLTESSNAYNELARAEDRNEEEVKAAADAYRTIQDELVVAKNEFIKTNNTKPVAAYIAYKETQNADYDELKTTLEVLGDNLKTNGFYIAMQKKCVDLEKVSVGKEAPDFTIAGIDGNPITLSSFRGKLLLVDFWASWCGPCRRENPNVLKAYEAYHDKGLEILGISLDNNREKWEQAIKDDGLIWNHASELKGWKGDVSALYCVNGIPHTVLIDQNGVIVAKNLRGEALVNKLSELLD